MPQLRSGQDDTPRRGLEDPAPSAASRGVLEELEALVRSLPADEAHQVVLPVALAVAPAAGIDRRQAAEEAAAYVESFPAPGRAVVDVEEMAGRWLALRLASDERRARLRDGLRLLSERWSTEFPLTSRVLQGLLAQPVPEDPLQDQLWLALARTIVDDPREEV